MSSLRWRWNRDDLTNENLASGKPISSNDFPACSCRASSHEKEHSKRLRVGHHEHSKLYPDVVWRLLFTARISRVDGASWFHKQDFTFSIRKGSMQLSSWHHGHFALIYFKGFVAQFNVHAGFRNYLIRTRLVFVRKWIRCRGRGFGARRPSGHKSSHEPAGIFGLATHLPPTVFGKVTTFVCPR